MTIKDAIILIQKEIESFEYTNDIGHVYHTFPDKLSKLKNYMIENVSHDATLSKEVDDFSIDFLDNVIKWFVELREEPTINEDKIKRYIMYAKKHTTYAVNGFLTLCNLSDKSILSKEEF